MAGPYSDEEIQRAIYQLVVSSKARQGEAFPVKYVLLNMEKRGFTNADFLQGAEALQKRGLITEDEKIADNFFDELKDF